MSAATDLLDLNAALRRLVELLADDPHNSPLAAHATGARAAHPKCPLTDACQCDILKS